MKKNDTLRNNRTSDRKTPDRGVKNAPLALPENLVIGRNAVRELLESGRAIDKIYTARGDRDGSITTLVHEAIERKIPVMEADRKKLDELSQGERHQGIVAFAAEKEYTTVEEMIRLAEEKGEAPFLVICDGIEDPHNLGAIIRSAECTGAHGIVIPKRRSVGLTAVVGRASAGAIEHMPIAKVTNLSQTVEELKNLGFWIYAADMGGTAYYDTDLTGRVALIMGSEGFGIQRLLKEKCDFTVSIPLYGKVNSMNVSAAAAVLLAEAARQRKKQ